MASSYQNEIPKARINITLDIETNGAKKKTELPMRLLMVGRFNEDGDKANVAIRDKISVNKNNFNQVLSDLAPKASFTVPSHIRKDQTDLRVNLEFKKMKDFHPESLVLQVPELRKLVAMRNLLKELKANVIDNKTLRKELEKIMQDQESMKNLQTELAQLTTGVHDE